MHGRPRHTCSDKAGRFTLFPQKGAYELAVAHKDGFVRVSSDAFEPGSDIVLAPWASLEGIVKSDGRPVPHTDIQIDVAPPLATAISLSLPVTAETDANGRFKVGRLPATKVTIAPVYDILDLLPPSEDPTPLKARPPKTIILSPGENKDFCLEWDGEKESPAGQAQN